MSPVCFCQMLSYASADLHARLSSQYRVLCCTQYQLVCLTVSHTLFSLSHTHKPQLYSASARVSDSAVLSVFPSLSASLHSISRLSVSIVFAGSQRVAVSAVLSVYRLSVSAVLSIYRLLAKPVTYSVYEYACISVDLKCQAACPHAISVGWQYTHIHM